MDSSSIYRFNKKYPFDNWTIRDGELMGYYPRNSIINILMQKEGPYFLENKIIHIPSTVKSIKSSCFRGNKNYEGIIIPETVTYIADNAFEDCSMTLMVLNGTYAHQFAMRKGLKYKVYEKGSNQNQSGSNQEA